MLNRKDLARLTKNELVDVTLKDIDLITTVFEEKIIEAIVNGDSVRLSNFGTIEPSMRKAHVGVDPATGEKVNVRATRTVRFRPCLAWRQEMNGLEVTNAEDK